jgi:hypothetical protein
MPESEATHYCTTAGGWAAVHDSTPDYWSSQQTSSGLLIGDFVPYVWLTNSDRAFLWFADNDKGWITDDDGSLPTQEIRREGGAVTLRVHFIEIPTELRGPTTVRWGYQTFPSRPLPKGWRSILCTQSTDLLPRAPNTYFWFDADWAVLWPYYCSPYPWSLEKSKKAFDRYPKDTIHRPCVGSIAHSIGRYRDYAGHKFDEYAVDWGATPGDRGNANCTQGRGPVDFRVYHYQMWVREAGFRGLYVDENYISLERNFLTGGAYHRPDGRLQQGYSYLGLREYFKRMKVMFHRNGVPRPNLWQHISSGAAYNSWFGDVFFEGENVEPTNEEFDYIEVLPAGRMRSIGSSACAGGVMTMMCQSQRHATVFEPKHTHQFVGWVMAHDILPEQVRFYDVIAQEGRLYEDEVEFIGYWKDESPFGTRTPGCVVSAHRTKGRALLWIVNTSREDRDADVTIDWRALGFDRGKCVALDAETGDLLAPGRRGLRVRVLKRDFVAVHLVERSLLTGDETFRASFDRGVDADEALGSCVFQPVGRRRGESRQLSLVDGPGGKALAVGTGVSMWPRLNVSDARGRVTFRALLKDKATGAVFSTTPPRGRNIRFRPAQPIAVSAAKNGLVFERKGSKEKPGERVTAPALARGWHEFDVSWNAGRVTLAVDGRAVGTVDVTGLNVGRGRGPVLTQAGRFVFGGRRGCVEAIDEVRCSRTAE